VDGSPKGRQQHYKTIFNEEIMKIRLAIIVALALAIFAPEVWAWGSDGHQTVGAIADSLLRGTNAEKQVLSILGQSKGAQIHLQQAAIWPDCVRDVGTDFQYNEHAKYRDAACSFFEDQAGEQLMVDYAKNNDSNCLYEDKKSQCHKAFHFADVPVDFGEFRDNDVGTPNSNIVLAMGAAIAKLTDQPVPAPFNIADKKEALMLLAHFVGDLHQPLHVGSVYLDSNGNSITPTKATFDPATRINGGNNLTGQGGELHGQWDAATPIAKVDIAGLAGAAKNLAPTMGDFHTWPAIWASESVVQAKAAYTGITYGTKTGGNWPMTFTDRGQYLADMKAMKDTQLVAAGARLANILQAIFP